MAIDEPGRDDDEFLSSLTRYHELLSAVPSGARPGDLPALPGSASSSRLQRAKDCLRLLHSTWSDERPESLPSQPREVPESLAAQEPRGPNGERVRVGRFEIVRELGRGAFGIVFLASDPVLGREVALKLPRPEAVFTPGFRRRFVREAQAAAAVSHPNLVSVYEAGEWGPACYIATEYCAGQTLAAWLFHRAEPVPPVIAATLVAGLARALDHVHNHGIIHRDLKPSNVILVPKAGSDAKAAVPDNQLEFVPKITDFGLAKLLERDPHETCSTGLLGTPAYMAPEQAEPRLGDVGRHTDVYALGVILYEMLAGRAPFTSTSDFETLKRVALDEPVPPRRLRRRLQRDLEAICLKCLEKQPSARYQTATALADDLERFLAGRTTKARPLGPLGRSLKAARRHRAVTALLATLVVLAVAGLAGHWSQAAHMRDVLGVNATMYNALVRDQASWIYARDVSSATAAWTTGQLADADDLLARHRRKTGEKDAREFVWHYLWRRCHAERLTIDGHGTPVLTVSCSRDGKLLASAGRDGVVHLSDAATGRELATFRGHVGDVNMVCFSSDGRLLATAGDDRTVRLWNVAPPGPRAILRGHTACVDSAAFSPDGKTVASAGGEEVVRLWDTATSRERLALHGHNGHVKRLAFSPDGRLLATAARDGTCQVWDLKTGRVSKEVDGSSGRSRRMYQLLTRRPHLGYGGRRSEDPDLGRRDEHPQVDLVGASRGGSRGFVCARRSDAGRGRQGWNSLALGPRGRQTACHRRRTDEARMARQVLAGRPDAGDRQRRRDRETVGRGCRPNARNNLGLDRPSGRLGLYAGRLRDRRVDPWTRRRPVSCLGRAHGQGARQLSGSRRPFGNHHRVRRQGTGRAGGDR